MEGSSAASSVSADDGPESWEVADVETSVRRLLLSSIKDSNLGSKKLDDAAETSDSGLSVSTAQNSGPSSGISDDLINTVDQFLREAIQNPRERVSVLRIEQDIENFIRDSTRDQMEFQQLPTSYLRLAAHRVAQHYSLQSMVLTDLPEGSGSRIIVRKTSNIRLPLVRLAEIPVNLPTEESGTVKVAIKQRPRKGQLSSGSSNSHPVRSNSLKSVEERKEEYNKARARIFNGSSSSGKLESDSRIQDSAHRGPAVIKKEEDRTHSGLSDSALSRSSSDIPTSSSRLHRNKTEKEVMGRPKTNNRVAIFRDREVDRKDPDYDRSYDRYMQRFDPGFGFSGGPYTIQPMYAPLVNYNTEFPQLGANHRPPISSEHQPRPLMQHLSGQWVPPSAPGGVGYGPAETMLPPFNPGLIGAHSNSPLYLNSVQYTCQQSGLPYLHPLDQIHQPFSQSHQSQSDTTFGIARPR